MFGDTVYEAFRQVKQAFDPHNLFNPGKIVDAPAMTENLRYGPDYAPRDPPVMFDYSKQQGFVRACRDVQWQRCVPQAKGRDDVSLLPGDLGREGQHPWPRQCFADGAGRGRPADSDAAKVGLRRARFVPDVQGVQVGMS